MDYNAKTSKPVKLFPQALVAGETIFSKQHYYPLLRPNGVDRWIINLTVAGRGRINRGKDEFMVERGELLLFPPGVPHDYEGRDWIHLWCYFDPELDWRRLLQWPEVGLGVKRLVSHDETFTLKLENIFRDLLRLYYEQNRNAPDFCTNKLEELLLWIDTLNTNSSLSFDQRIADCRSFMYRNLHCQLSIKDLAAQCNMSPSRFAHWFKEKEGIAPIKYLENMRIEKAKELLSFTGLQISEIAEATGYQDPQYFSRVFTRNQSITPRHFRNKLGH